MITWQSFQRLNVRFSTDLALPSNRHRTMAGQVLEGMLFDIGQTNGSVRYLPGQRNPSKRVRAPDK
jgi:hypothetical protein